MAYKSGFCSAGMHEGIAPKNLFGHALPTCRMESTQCSCSCHSTLDEMFRLSDMERITIDKSGYIADHPEMFMPDLTELAVKRASSQRATLAVERIESPAPDVVPATIARTFAPTPTGRAGKGELEQQVDAVCKVWAVDAPGELCIPKWIASEIAQTYGIREPSVGAIGAVFDRWVELGYAECARKPVRFVAYTELGRELGLDGCKERARRTKARVAR